MVDYKNTDALFFGESCCRPISQSIMKGVGFIKNCIKIQS